MFRMFRAVTIAALTLPMIAGCASQSAPVSTFKGKAEKVASTNAPDAVTCRNVVQTGSRFTTRYCMSNKDWKERDRATQEGAREAMYRTELNAQQSQNMAGQ